MNKIAAIACFMILLSTGWSQTPSKPNIVFIVIDDLNDYVEGMNGQPQIATPHIQSMIDQGYLFANGFCNSPVCAPSRTSFLSGKDPLYTQVYANNTYLGHFRDNFSPDKNNEEVITLPEQLKNKGGYYTISINKVFHDPLDKDYDNVTVDPCLKSMSWSKVISFSETGAALATLEAGNVGVTGFKWGQVEDDIEPDMKDYRAVDSAMHVLDQIQSGDISLCGSAFFLALGFDMPHLDLYVNKKYYPEFYLNHFYGDYFNIPYNDPVNTFPPNGVVMPPQPEVKWDDYYHLGPLGQAVAQGQVDIENSFDKYMDSLITMPEVDPALTDSIRREVVEESKRADAVMAYMAGVQFVDAQLGRLMDYMQAHPDLYYNTIFVLVGDNGFSLGEKKHWLKRSFWESDVRVPFVIFDPNRPGNKICDQTVGLLDLYPTICDLTHTNYPVFNDGSYYLDGKSIAPLLDMPEKKWERPVLISWRAEGNKECSCFTQNAVRSEKFKYIRYASDGDNPANACNIDSSFNEEELYEIGVHRETDPNEWHNLINEPAYQPVIDYLQQWLPDSLLYLQSTFTAEITDNPLPCLLSYTDSISLSFNLYDTTGALISPPAGYIYRWINNLTNDTIYNASAIFEMSSIPPDVFINFDHILFFIQMIRPADGAIVAMDNQYFYLGAADTPIASFHVTIGEPLQATVSDIVIKGSYQSIWWDYGDGHIFYGPNPGPYMYASPGTHHITCHLKYGNSNDCESTYTQTIDTEIPDASGISTLYIYPNPSYSVINVITTNPVLDGLITISDITGKIVKQVHAENNTYPLIQIVINDLSPGIYLISRTLPQNIECGKFIVIPKK